MILPGSHPKGNKMIYKFKELSVHFLIPGYFMFYRMVLLQMTWIIFHSLSKILKTQGCLPQNLKGPKIILWWRKKLRERSSKERAQGQQWQGGEGMEEPEKSSLKPREHVTLPTVFFLHRMLLSFHNLALSLSPSPSTLKAQSTTGRLHVALLNLFVSQKEMNSVLLFSILLPLGSITTF